MNKKCDLCEINDATTSFCITKSGVRVEYSLCDECYRNIVTSGRSIEEVMSEKLNSIGKVCKSCGLKLEDFQTDLLFGCPDCYKYMREAAFKATATLQKSTIHRGKKK